MIAGAAAADALPPDRAQRRCGPKHLAAPRGHVAPAHDEIRQELRCRPASERVGDDFDRGDRAILTVDREALEARADLVDERLDLGRRDDPPPVPAHAR